MWIDETSIAAGLSSGYLNSNFEDTNAPDAARNLALAFKTNIGFATGKQDSTKPIPKTTPTTKDNNSTLEVITTPFYQNIWK